MTGCLLPGCVQSDLLVFYARHVNAVDEAQSLQLLFQLARWETGTSNVLVIDEQFVRTKWFGCERLPAPAAAAAGSPRWK